VAISFRCRDCLVVVHALGIDRAPDPPLCWQCRLLQAVADPAERRAVRLLLDPPPGEDPTDV